jgi:tetratricopeptide (TPR) repeat protein
MKRICCSLFLGAVLFGAGCATTTRYSFPLTGDPLVDAPRAIVEGPERDRVLWQYRGALAAMRAGDYEQARVWLDDALLTIGGIFGPDPDARRARGYFREEAKKTFIGEPYERVMAWYYRGILYWMDGEPDNARACFRSAQLQDADTESHEYASDCVLLDYLDGLATAKLAGDGSDAYARALESARLSKPPPYEVKDNVLLFVEFGPGPVKYATGEHREELRFRVATSQVRSAVIRAGGRAVNALPYDDLYYQATTRGGRVMDHVLANQAVFKSATGTAGDAALITGAILAQRRQTQEAGLAVLAAGLIGKIVSAGTRPEADTRCWTSLPQFLSFASLSLPPGAHELRVEFRDAGGRVLPSLGKTVRVEIQDTRSDQVVFISDQSSTPLIL